MKKSKRLLSMLMTAALAVSMTATSAFAATTFNFTYPEEPMDVNSTTGTGGSRYLTTLAQRASSEIPLVFGINVVGGNIFDGLRTMAGTSVSTNPDPYLWNFNYLYPNYKRMSQPDESMMREGVEMLPSDQYYNYLGNALTNANGLYNSGGANQVYANVSDDYGGVGAAVGYRADVMIGFNSALVDQIDTVRSWKSGDEFYREGDENYSPLIVDVQTGSVTSRLYSWMDMAQGIDAYLEAHPEFAIRYGAAQTIAGDLEQFSAGIPYYIASLIADGKLEKKTMAYVYNIDGTTYNCINPRSAGDVSADVYGEVNNFEFLEGSYTLKEIMDAGTDVIVLGQSGYAYTGGSIGRDVVSAASSSNKQNVFKELADLGYKADEVPMVLDGTTRNVTFGGQGYNYAPTTPMYMTFIQAYCYMEELEEVNEAINPMALYRFMYEEFGHVNASSAEDVALYNLGSNWDSVDDEYDTVPDLSDYTYDKEAIIAAIREGVAFAQSSRAEYLGNTLVPAVREGEGAYTILTEQTQTEEPESGHDFITLTLNGETVYLDLTALAEYDDGSSSSSGDGSNNTGSAFSNTRTSYQAIIDYYNGSEYGYGDDLQTTLQNYADHMVAHVWDPDTTISGTYAEGVGQSSFTDVEAGTWYDAAVAWAVKKGVTTGTSATTFSPSNTCNRAQMVTFLYRAAGSPNSGAANNPFVDVSTDSYYFDAVMWAVDKGITNGMDATHFNPNGDVTRGQAVTFMNRLENEKASSSTNPFTDVTSGTYYYDSVLWAVEKGITNGMSATTFEPETTCTRAHIVTFLNRYLG